ncbi:hypothetical protein CRG98_037519 [Punica granatum]|uniref:Uncharacterized protein n=1 Tax=Punica granatum TaxID=22663 RepID=A0A2I0IFC6_PUNGR|nr:hypothetical protein CRG98_037519 [Punica granatum]
MEVDYIVPVGHDFLGGEDSSGTCPEVAHMVTLVEIVRRRQNDGEGHHEDEKKSLKLYS